MAERCKNSIFHFLHSDLTLKMFYCNLVRAPTKYDKVVRREVCQVTSKGTRLYLAIEGDASNEDHSYLIAVTEGVGSCKLTQNLYLL